MLELHIFFFQMFSFVRFLTLLVISLTFSGCETSGHQRVFKSLPATDPEFVVVMYKKPEKDYVVIGENQMLNVGEKQVRKWSASIGADAAIVVVSSMISTTSGMESKSGSSKIVETLEGKKTKQAFVTAIKFK